MLKKLSFVIFFLAGMTSFAQRTEFGIKGGLNFSNLAGDASSEFEWVTSFHIGGLVEFQVNDFLSIQPEAQYSLQGFGFTNDENVSIGYVNIPVLAKFYLGGKNFSLEAGPQFGIKVSSKYDFDGGSADIEEGLNNFDFSGVLSASYEFDNNLFFSARYIAGYTNVIEKEAFAGEDASTPNSVFQLSVGYKFQ